MNKFILCVPFLLLSTVACDTLHENFSGACWMTEDSRTATLTMRCPDGSRATWDAPYGDGNCMISEDAEGLKTIHCPDGSSAVLPVYVEESIGDEAAVCTVTEGPAEERILKCGDEQAVLSSGCSEGYPGNIQVPTNSSNQAESNAQATPGNEIVYPAHGCNRILGSLFFGESSVLPAADPLWDVREVGFLLFAHNASLDGARSFRALTFVDNFETSWEHAFESLKFPVLTGVRAMSVSTGFSTLLFPRLATVDSLFISIYEYSSDQGGVLPALEQVVDLFIDGDVSVVPLLTGGLPNLKRVSGSLDLSRIEGAEAVCAAEAFIARLTAAGGLEGATVTGPEGECPAP